MSFGRPLLVFIHRQSMKKINTLLDYTDALVKKASVAGTSSMQKKALYKEAIKSALQFRKQAAPNFDPLPVVNAITNATNGADQASLVNAADDAGNLAKQYGIDPSLIPNSERAVKATQGVLNSPDAIQGLANKAQNIIADTKIDPKTGKPRTIREQANAGVKQVANDAKLRTAVQDLFGVQLKPAPTPSPTPNPNFKVKKF